MSWGKNICCFIEESRNPYKIKPHEMNKEVQKVLDNVGTVLLNTCKKVIQSLREFCVKLKSEVKR